MKIVARLALFSFMAVACWLALNAVSTTPRSDADVSKSMPGTTAELPNEEITHARHLDTLSRRTKDHAATALAFAERRGMNTDFCIMVDMSIHSGLYRLFVWDYAKDTITLTGLCSHGCGRHAWGVDDTKEAPVFSNKPESHLSSLGKYKIGARGYSNWGISVNYKMHGLSPTNSNAYKRVIVLHSWESVPDEEPYPQGTPEGWGCPAVSNQTMRTLDEKLTNAKKPVLMWLYR